MLNKQRIFRRSLLINFVIISLTTSGSLYCQSYASRDNYTGNWEDSLSWIPIWHTPLVNLTDTDIIINGYITVNGDLNFYGVASSLIINDTLVIRGDLTLGNNNDITINDGGILIIRDTLTINNQTVITANGYLIVTNDLIKSSSLNQGAITSNDDPVKIFVCGSVSNVALTDDNVSYPALNCSSPSTLRYPNSNCSYGNLYDLMNDPIYSFYNSICPLHTAYVYADGPLSFCDGDSVTLMANEDASYQWSSGDTTRSIYVKTSGYFSVTTTDTNGCKSTESVPVTVNVNQLPGEPVITASGSGNICAGDSITLTSSQAYGYLWSTGATTRYINLSTSGNYTVQVLSDSGCMSEPSQPFVITVNSIPVVRITSSNISMCSNEQRILTADPAGGSFMVTDGPGIIDGNTLTATGPGVISLEYTYTDMCTGTDTQSVTVDEYVAANAGPDQDLVYVFSAEMNASPPSAGFGEWSVVSGSGNISDVSSPATAITGLSSGINIFSWNVQNGSCTSTDEVIVDVKDIITPTVITPNNDGLNDVLIFPGLSAFPSSKLIIYDRWGDEVYRSPDYLNDWSGKDKKNRDLQPDTYYYVLTISNGRTIKGFIEIRR